MNSSDQERILSAQRLAKAGQYRQALEALKDVEHPKASEWRAKLERRLQQDNRRPPSMAAFVSVTVVLIALIGLVIGFLLSRSGAVPQVIATVAPIQQVASTVAATPSVPVENPNDRRISYLDYCLEQTEEQGFAPDPRGWERSDAWRDYFYDCNRELVQQFGSNRINTMNFIGDPYDSFDTYATACEYWLDQNYLDGDSRRDEARYRCLDNLVDWYGPDRIED